MIAIDSVITLFLNGLHAPFWDVFFFNLTHTSVWAVAVLALIVGYAFRSSKKEVILFVLFLAHAILLSDQITSTLLKPLVHRLRPSHALAGIHLVNGYAGGMYGFPSSHAANCVAVACLSAYCFRDRLFAVLIWIWAVLMAYSRIYLGVHYLGDILVGGAIGALVGVALIFLFKRIMRAQIVTKEPLWASYLPSAAICATFIFLIISAFCTKIYF